MSTVAFKPLTVTEQVFYDLIWKPMIQSGESWLELHVPFLALPIIKQLDEVAIESITNAIFRQIIQVVDVTAIQLVNATHQAAYDSASEQLLIVAEEKGTQSNEYKKAQADALAALSQFVHVGAQ